MLIILMHYLIDDSKDRYEAVGEAKLSKICDISLAINMSGGLYLIPKDLCALRICILPLHYTFNCSSCHH